MAGQMQHFKLPVAEIDDIALSYDLAHHRIVQAIAVHIAPRMGQCCDKITINDISRIIERLDVRPRQLRQLQCAAILSVCSNS